MELQKQTPDKYDYRFNEDYQARVRANYNKLREEDSRGSETSESVSIAPRGKLLAAAAAGVAVIALVTGTNTTTGEGVVHTFGNVAHAVGSHINGSDPNANQYPKGEHASHSGPGGDYQGPSAGEAGK